MKIAPLSVAQMFLLSSLNVPIAPVVNQGQLTPGYLVIKKEITGAGGIKQLIDSATKEVVGTSTFQAQRLPTGTKMVIEGIRLGLAVVATTDTTSAAGQLYLNKSSGTEAKFRAANLIINRDGKEIFKEPVSRFLTGDAWHGMIGKDDIYWPEELRLLQGDEKLEIQLEFPDDVDWTASKKVFVSVEMFGPKLQF